MRFRSAVLPAIFAATLSVPALAQQTDPTAPAGAPGQTAPAGGPTLTVDSSGQTTVGAPAQAGPKDEVKKEEPKKAATPPPRLIWRGSTAVIDQSMTPETVGIGHDYQTRNPLYQLWISVRPRVWLLDDGTNSININARIDMYKEMTSSDDSTLRRQNILGDIWINAPYSRKLYRKDGYATSVSFGPRVLLPTSMDSRARGVIVTAGAGGGVVQMFPLSRGSDWFSSARVAGIAYYTHAFTKATTRQDADTLADRPTMQTDGRTGRNYQLSGGFLVNHQFLGVLDTGVQITDKLGFTFDAIFISQWKYNHSEACTPVTISNGTACGGSNPDNPDPQRYTLLSWILGGFDYQLTEDLNLALGYYHVTNTIAPSGNRQNLFYSPDGGRFYLTATVGLDALYERFRGKPDDGPNSPAGGARGLTKGTPPPGLGSF
ncbi:MAG: acid shock protein [Polyangiaceae bacterium]|nr:acid shock protein [Polyangiaceae bacterium]